jgi:hypothetical protein
VTEEKGSFKGGEEKKKREKKLYVREKGLKINVSKRSSKTARSYKS